MIKRKAIQLLIIFILMITASSFAFCLEGEGEGGGLNSGDPLVLVTSSPIQNQTDVPVDSVIHLEFNKNVVNMSVAENNKQCFNLTDGEGQSIDIQVRMGDDQVDPTIKRMVDVIPAAVLTEEEKYTLTISQNFTAKNGTSLTAPITLDFYTEQIGSGLQKADNPEANLSEPLDSKDAESDLNTQAEPPSQTEVSSDQDAPNQAGGLVNHKDTVLIVSVGCIAAAVVLLVIYVRRRIK